MQQVALVYDTMPEAAPVRRRIIQQPLRTEASFALIASDATPLGELADRLKRTHPVITFPSLSHFLAEPPRRDRWEAILVARSGAWDPRLDAYVRSRARIALFGLPEESYGWPDAVGRVRDLTELEPWLEALNAPPLPPPKKERAKRTPRTPASVAPAQPSGRASQPAPAASTEALPPGADAARQSTAPKRAGRKPRQVELDLPGIAKHKPSPRAQRAAKAAPAPRPHDLVREVLADHHARRITAADRAADHEFMRLAAELGLTRAVAIMDGLRERAARLASAARRTSP
jgi:hypothetical protein